MIKTTEALAPTEQTRLDQCELAIERGLNTFVEVGRALTEIRDSKLYRIGFKTFEEYCDKRWKISRPRAYALIEQAGVGAALVEAAGINLSCAQDISSRDAAAVKASMPAVTAEIKSRVEQGADPETAVKEAVRTARQKSDADRLSEQAKNDAAQRAAQAALPPAVKEQQEARQAAIDIAKSKKTELEPAGVIDAERIAELEEQVRVLEHDYEEVVTENKKFGAMRAAYQKGGFEAVISGRDEQIRVLEGRLFAESEAKASWMRKANFWKQKAKDLGWRDTRFDGRDENDAADMAHAEG